MAVFDGFCLLFVMFWGMDIVFLLTFPVILQTILCILSGKIQYWWVLSSISLKQFRNDKYNYNHKNSTFQHPPSVANGQKRLVLKNNCRFCTAQNNSEHIFKTPKTRFYLRNRHSKSLKLWKMHIFLFLSQKIHRTSCSFWHPKITFFEKMKNLLFCCFTNRIWQSDQEKWSKKHKKGHAKIETCSNLKRYKMFRFLRGG